MCVCVCVCVRVYLCVCEGVWEWVEMGGWRWVLGVQWNSLSMNYNIKMHYILKQFTAPLHANLFSHPVGLSHKTNEDARHVSIFPKSIYPVQIHLPETNSNKITNIIISGITWNWNLNTNKKLCSQLIWKCDFITHFLIWVSCFHVYVSTQQTVLPLPHRKKNSSTSIFISENIPGALCDIC